MNYKKPSSVLIATLVLASMILVYTGPQIPRVSAPVAPDLPTDWPSVYFCTDTLGICNETYPMEANVSDTVTFALVVFNLTATTVSDPANPSDQDPLGNLTGFDVQMSWNPSVLNLTSCTVTIPWNSYQTPVAPSPYGGVFYGQTFELANETDQADNITDAVPGTMLWRGYVQMNMSNPFNGNGTLLVTTFNVISVGSSVLNLTACALSDYRGRPLLFHKSNAYFHTPGVPVADFSFWPDVGVVNRTVVFNASASYSPLSLGIVNYTWNFGDSNITTVTDPMVNHTYTKAVSFKVSLEVTDSAGVSSSPKTEACLVVGVRNVKVSDVNFEGKVNTVVNRTVEVAVLASDAGEANENCTANAYYNVSAIDFNDIYGANWTKIGEVPVVILASKDVPLTFEWNTTGIAVNASYYVMANLTQVPYESNTIDNTMVSPTSLNVTDRAIEDVSVEQLYYGWQAQGIFEHPALNGETSMAAAIVHNVGTEDENVTLTVYRNGTIWHSQNQTLLSGNTGTFNASAVLPVGTYNITVEATILADANLANNVMEAVLDVIALPHLNFTYTPTPAIVNQTIAFDASQSYHGQSGANITSYRWEFWEPGAMSVTHTDYNVTADYVFDSAGTWRVILYITDSYGLQFESYRSKTNAYMLEVAVSVQEAAGGFPIEYLLAVIIIAVVIAVLAAVLIRWRRSRKT